MTIGVLFARLVVLKVFFNVFRYLFVKAWRAKRAIDSSISDTIDSIDSDRVIVILFPLLEESMIVPQVIKTAERLIQEAPQQVQVVFACSGRENHLGDQSTSRRLQDELTHFTSISKQTYIYLTDGSDRCKADQMNHALSEHLISLYTHQSDKVWIGVYDADSSPQSGTIHELLNLSKSGAECVYQQAPLYTKSWERFKEQGNFFKHIFCLSRALYSHLFSYKESFGYLCSGGLFDLRLHHFTGHGYFVRLDTLQRFGGFDPPSCDTTLGYKLSFGGIPFVLMQTRDLSEVPHDPKTIFRQGIVWFNGCELYLREYFKGKKSVHRVESVRNYCRILQVFFTNLSWSFLPIFWSITCILTFNTCPADWSLAIGLWLSFRYVIWIDMLSLDKECSKVLSVNKIIFSPIMAPISVIWGCFSPLRYYHQKILRGQIELVKTNRAKLNHCKRPNNPI